MSTELLLMYMYKIGHAFFIINNTLYFHYFLNSRMTMTSISGRVILRFPNRTKEKWLRFTPHQRFHLPTTQTPPHTASAGDGQDDVDDDKNDNDDDLDDDENDNGDDFDDDDAPALATLKR